jgi:tetratricopeptide (TPR) repeat protein
MTRTALPACLLLTLAVSIGLIAQSAAQSAPSGASAQELYQRGLVQEHAQGDLQQAIALYAQAARMAGSDRALAAKALIRMAGSQQKLGANADAARAYAEVVRAYPEQRPVGIARHGWRRSVRNIEREGLRWSCCRDDVSSSARPFVETTVNCTTRKQDQGRRTRPRLGGHKPVREDPALWRR